MSNRERPEPSGRAALADWKAFCAKHPEVSYLNAVFTDQCGTVRGKRIPVAEGDKVFTHGLQLPMSVYFLDVTGVNEDICGRGFSDGDPDGTAFPIAGTLASVPWASDQAQVLMTMETPEGDACEFEPRNALARIADRLAARGLTPVSAVEFEFYLLDPKTDERGRPRPPINPSTGEREKTNQVYGLAELDGFGDLLQDIGSYASCLSVPASAAVAEFAPGQYEINLKHGPDPLRSGDDGILLRYLIGAAAREHGFRASFMAKPYADQVGNGCHVHTSLLDGDGRNIFDDSGEDGTEMMRHAIGGLQRILPASMALLAPNLNAYRRFGPNLFVPVNGAWGYNNRSVAFRVPTGASEARRIEHRVAGADANPYLVLAAILAGIDHGIENKIDPGEPTAVNACDQVDPNLPLALPRALDTFIASPVMRDYFGDVFVDIYAETKRQELEKFNKAISTRELEWYL